MHQLRAVRNIRLGIKSLMLHKLRSLLTILGVVFGVGSVIAMLSVGEGASREALEQIRKLGSNNIIIDSIEPLEEKEGSDRPERVINYGLTYEDEKRIAETVESVRRTVPAKVIDREGYVGERTMELRIVGTTLDWFDLVDRKLLAGRVLSQRDMDSHAPVCVLTEYGARRLLATEYTIGKFVRMGNDYYEVIGIVQSEQVSGSIQTPDRHVDAYVPLDTARDRYGDSVVRFTAGTSELKYIELAQILVEVESTEQVSAAAEAIGVLLRNSHPRLDYRIAVPLALLRQTEATKRTFNIVLGSIAGISLLVGGIGIMNIMLASVTERTREIGIRRAIGAKRRQIIGQFLIETIVLTTVGGLIGTALGVAFPKAITHWSGMPTIVPAYSIVLSLSISVAVGLVFGMYPAIRAAALDPIEALRHE